MKAGTSVKGTLPEPKTVLAALDQAAQAAAKEAKDIARAEWNAQAPHGRTDLVAHPNASVTKTKTGWAVNVSPPLRKQHGPDPVSIRKVVHWVTVGTGVFRTTPGPKGPIHARKRAGVLPKRMTLPGGAKRWTVQGQHPNPFVQRTRDLARARVTSTLSAGAAAAAKKIREM